MENATVPKPRATSRRRASAPRLKARQVSMKVGTTRSPRVAAGLRGSCFHSAIAFSTMVASAAPWITWISRIWLNGCSTAPNTRALATMPNSSIMHSSATTVGCDSGGDRSVASASPTVCVVCSPAPTIKKASAAAACPTQGAALLSPDNRISANGMIANPPNCTSVPIQR